MLRTQIRSAGPWAQAMVRSPRLRRHVVLAVAALALGNGACGSDSHSSTPQRVAVLSAFPGEGAAVVAQATDVSPDTMVINGRTFRFGTLGGVPVIMGLTGIGPANAAATTAALLDQFPVTGVVVSAVAGGMVQIGDVLVPDHWELAEGPSYACDRHALSLARRIAAPGEVALAQCTIPQSMTEDGQVCFPEMPVIIVGGVGQTTDPLNGGAPPCVTGDPVFGCDSADGDFTVPDSVSARPALRAAAAAAPPVASDNETAVIAAEAATRGIPFIAFRGVSDGAGDPFGDRGYPAQFFDYYPFSAHNAAAATVAFLQRVAAGE